MAVTDNWQQRAAATADAAVVTLEGVSKRFGDLVAVDGLTLTVPAGQILGLIGPSGCGKSTVVRLMLGILAPDTGTVRLRGHDPTQLPPAQRALIGYMPQSFVLYPTLTTSENLRFIAGLLGLAPWRRRRAQRLREVLELLELWTARHRLARDLSGGMERRLALAAALIHRPPLLLVDEPTAGLDPALRQRIWGHLQALRSQGTTVIVTTQIIDEASWCDTVAVLAAGRLVAHGTPAVLRRRAFGGALIDLEVAALARDDLQALRALPGVHAVRWRDDDRLRLVVDDLATATPAVIETLQARGVAVIGATPSEPSFDEVFLALLGARHG